MRGKKGTALINISSAPQNISIATMLPNGKYKDVVYQNTFVVSHGILKGTLKPLTSYILSR